MSAANFRGMGDFGIWAMDDPEDTALVEENYGYIQSEIDKLNSKLKFHRLGLSPGYYSGLEIVLQDQPASEDPKVLAEILNEADMYSIPYWNYGDSAKREDYQKKAKVKYIEEWRAIDNWLNTVAYDLGFRELGITAKFSNGETFYRESPRSTPVAEPNPNEYFFSQERKPFRKKGFVPLLKRK